MFPNISLNFITNNVKRIQSYKKRLIQYFKKKKKKDQLECYFCKKLTLVVKLNKNGKRILRVMFFSHWKTNSCCVLTAFFGNETFNVKKQETDKEGRILILDVSINDLNIS